MKVRSATAGWKYLLFALGIGAVAVALVVISMMRSGTAKQPHIKSNMELWDEAHPNWVNVDPTHPNSKLYRRLCLDDKANRRILQSDPRC